MNFKLPVFLLLFLFSPALAAQVFVSNILEETIFLGPANISQGHYELAHVFVEGIEDALLILRELETSNDLVIAELNSMSNLKRKDKVKLSQSELVKELLVSEILSLEEFLGTWTSLQSQYELIQMIENGELDGSCFVAYTNREEYNFNEIDFQIVELNDESGSSGSSASEFIPVDIKPGGSQWVKKKANRNCLSADPNDCLVWCLVEVGTTYNFTDILGTDYSFESCPVGFDLVGSLCKKPRTELLSETNKVLKMALTATGEAVNIDSWEKIDCE